MTTTVEQQRAADALRRVNYLRGCTDQKDWNDLFASYAESLPSSILTNGLGQAAASLLARAKGNERDAHYVLYKYLQAWLCRDAPEAPYRGAQDLMQALVTGDRNTYLRAQAEALAWLQWMKRFATAYLKKPPKESQAGGDQ